jgi:hypothetical protein
MRKWFLIVGVLVLSSAWLVAQSRSSPPPAPDNSQYNQQPSSSSQQQPDASQTKEPAATAGTAHTIEGCITSVAGGYTLTDNSGKTYQLSGDTSKLANEVGHDVKATGTEESQAGGAAAGAGAPSTFTVRKIKVVSTTCPTK